MPEPNRAPWLIDGRLGGWAVWKLVENRVTVAIKCDACGHVAEWRPVDLDRKFAGARGRNMTWIAPRLRCSRCRSNWVRISMTPGSLMSS